MPAFLTVLIFILINRSYGATSVEPCYCTMQYDPVCCDGATYSNQCVAGCAGKTECGNGQCTATTDEPTTSLESNKPCYCAQQYDPVCCDGTTYSNKCVARCSDKTRCSQGRCVTTTESASDTTAAHGGVCCDGPSKYSSSSEAQKAGASECFSDYSVPRCLFDCVACDRRVTVCCSDRQKYRSDTAAYEAGATECTAYFRTPRCLFGCGNQCTPLSVSSGSAAMEMESSDKEDDKNSGWSVGGYVLLSLIVVLIVTLVVILGVCWYRNKKMNEMSITKNASYVAFEKA